jgi:hypothetical protein
MMTVILAAVVVELFTSQGCSSCPPADALLHELRKDPNVIPIAYHVDYWNYLGWRDPFSSHDWTARQMMYQKQFSLGSSYTPQMVVNGSREMIGSNAGQVRDAINEAAQVGSIATVNVTFDQGDVVVHMKTPRPGLQLIVVTTEDGLVTKVERGENRGLTITNDSIARSLTRFPNLAAGAATQRVVIDLKRGSVVAMLQDPATLRIVAAAMARLPS